MLCEMTMMNKLGSDTVFISTSGHFVRISGSGYLKHLLRKRILFWVFFTGCSHVIATFEKIIHRNGELWGAVCLQI